MPRRSQILGWLLGLLAALSAATSAAQAQSFYARKGSNASAVIVFVHGVLGDAASTWSNGTESWPAMIATDPAFDKADVFVVSYPTSFWGNLSIDELADSIRLQMLGLGALNYPTIDFVAHSMGGLATRSLLLKYRPIAEKTGFVYFFSTPTTGTQISALATLLSSNPQLQQMKPMNSDGFLADQARAWLAAGFSFPSYCAYEKRTTKSVEVVTFASASQLCTKPVDPIDADHFDIAKPADRAAATYLALKSAFETESSKPKPGAAKPDGDGHQIRDVNQTCTGNGCTQIGVINNRP